VPESEPHVRTLGEAGREDAVTLREVARRVGVSAPSIYRHFDSPDAIISAVVEQSFSELTTQLRLAVETEREPVARLRAVGRGYVAFGLEQRLRYRILFERRRRREGPSPAEHAASIERMPGADAFAVLLEAMTDCVDAGCSSAPSALRAATELWVALHGYITLRPATQRFPWPERDELVESLMLRLARIEPQSGATVRPEPGTPPASSASNTPTTNPDK
jgi:AcrR family transcriptional regulator